jgi:formylglycine-generating enzyme required for sulfatase activity
MNQLKSDKRMLSCSYAVLSVALFSLVASLTHASETTNKFGITMIDIPSGEFQMGSCKVTEGMMEEKKKRAFLGLTLPSPNCAKNDQHASDDETPQHLVKIRAFQIGKTEVTLGQFKRFIISAGRSDLVNDRFMEYNSYGDSAPVVMVTWHDAQDFVAWLNKTDGSGWRLPSEAEWEYACRAGSSSHSFCGSDDMNAVGWWKGNNGGELRPVASKQPNAFGLYDMSGNVGEWVEDCWHSNYLGAPTDGSAWIVKCEIDVNERVLRGGPDIFNSWNTRAASRSHSSSVPYFDYGFRLARTR